MSQGVYKILTATQGRTYNGKHGDLVVWHVTLENAQPENGAAHFELHKKPGNTPQAGDTIEVDRFAPGEHNGNPHVRIFAASNFQGGGSSSTGGGGGGGYDSPERIARMSRSHAQEMALLLIQASGDAEELNLEKPEVVAMYLNGTVSRLARWFEADVARAGEAAKAAPQPPPQVNGGGGEIPADTAGLPVGSSSGHVTPDDQIEF